MTLIALFHRIRGRTLLAPLAVLTASGFAACQDYENVFQPDTHREGVHLRFEVQQPSLADILFVVDNSISMTEKQAALRASFRQMVDFLSSQDTDYRVGIVSTDTRGNPYDCCLQTINDPVGGGLGNCGRCDCVTSGDVDCNDDTDCPGALTCNLNATPADPVNFAGRCFGASCQDCLATAGGCSMDVQILRPHDGTLGRLIAAYDPAVFDLAATDDFGVPLFPDTLIPQNLETPLLSLFPDPFGNPVTEMPWVIDRRQIRERACEACGCAVDDCSPAAEDPACFEQCARPITQAMVVAYFTSNLNGLGINGTGYEEGLKAAMWAVGIDPFAPTPETALNPGSYLTVPETFATPAGPNTYTQIDPITGLPDRLSWVRPDALLAIMFVTDEEDCSMSPQLLTFVPELELDKPKSSVCYINGFDAQFLQRDEAADLLTTLKGSPSRLTVGVIGGLRQAGNPGAIGRAAQASDCITEPLAAGEQPDDNCACLQVPTGAGGSSGWCPFTNNTTPGVLPECDTLAGNRYVDFANQFRRKTFDSVCRGCDTSGTSCEAYGPALEDFARLATLACFELGDVRPANCHPLSLDLCDPTLIEVKHATRDEVDDGIAPSLLTMVDPDTTQPPDDGGWFYDPTENLICLVGIDRSIGDVYEIFILHTNELTFTQ